MAVNQQHPLKQKTDEDAAERGAVKAAATDDHRAVVERSTKSKSLTVVLPAANGGLSESSSPLAAKLK